MTDSQDTIKETAQVLEGEVVVGPGATQAGDAAEDVEDAPPPTSGDNPVVVTVTRRTTITDTAGNVLRDDAATQSTDMETSSAQEDDFMKDLTSMGWTPRGRANPPTATKGGVKR